MAPWQKYITLCIVSTKDKMFSQEREPYSHQEAIAMLGARWKSAWPTQSSDGRTSGGRGNSGEQSEHITQRATRLRKMRRPRKHENIMHDCRAYVTLDRATVYGIVPSWPHKRDTVCDGWMACALRTTCRRRPGHHHCTIKFRTLIAQSSCALGQGGCNPDGRRDDPGLTGPWYPTLPWKDVDFFSAKSSCPMRYWRVMRQKH